MPMQIIIISCRPFRKPINNSDSNNTFMSIGSLLHAQNQIQILSQFGNPCVLWPVSVYADLKIIDTIVFLTSSAGEIERCISFQFRWQNAQAFRRVQERAEPGRKQYLDPQSFDQTARYTLNIEKQMVEHKNSVVSNRNLDSSLEYLSVLEQMLLSSFKLRDLL